MFAFFFSQYNQPLLIPPLSKPHSQALFRGPLNYVICPKSLFSITNDMVAVLRFWLPFLVALVPLSSMFDVITHSVPVFTGCFRLMFLIAPGRQCLSRESKDVIVGI